MSICPICCQRLEERDLVTMNSIVVESFQECPNHCSLRTFYYGNSTESIGPYRWSWHGEETVQAFNERMRERARVIDSFNPKITKVDWIKLGF